MRHGILKAKKPLEPDVSREAEDIQRDYIPLFALKDLKTVIGG